MSLCKLLAFVLDSLTLESHLHPISSLWTTDLQTTVSVCIDLSRSHKQHILYLVCTQNLITVHIQAYLAYTLWFGIPTATFHSKLKFYQRNATCCIRLHCNPFFAGSTEDVCFNTKLPRCCPSDLESGTWKCLTTTTLKVSGQTVQVKVHRKSGVYWCGQLTFPFLLFST